MLPTAIPLVSVLVTTYNRESYLNECLASVVASTWRDLEVILVDDCSRDDSVAIAREWAARDSRVTVVRNESNLGDYPNRMRAARLARGRYLKYVDSDDVIYPDSLAFMVGAMEANPDAAFALSCALPENQRANPVKLSSADAWKKEFLGDGCLTCGPTGAIIRRDSFFDIGGFREWGILSDTDLWYRMSARWTVMLLPPGLVWWRRHEDQEFTKDSAANVYLERGFELTLEALSSGECPLGEIDRMQALNRAKQHHARRLISLAFRRGKPRLALQLMRKSGLSGSQLLQGFAAYT